MSSIHKYFLLSVLLSLAVLSSACGPLITPVQTSGQAPSPVMRYEGGATPDPDVFVDPAEFQTALLQAIQSRDQTRLERMTAENFTSGWWHGEMSDQPRASALNELYRDQLGSSNRLEAADTRLLSDLMGGANPLTFLSPAANVVSTIFVTGWGKDGRDEALLFVSRQPDNSLRWAGTMVIQGGFTSPETGGVEPFVNPAHGYQVYLPKGYEPHRELPDQVGILAPQGTEGHRLRAMISVEPAGGRTAEQAAEAVKAELPGEFASQTGTVLGLDTEAAFVLDRVPSQDMQRVLFAVHDDRLYQIIFIPSDETAGEAYRQMQTLYSVVVNTFKFIPVVQPTRSTGGKLVADPQVFIGLLQQGLQQRDPAALQSMMDETFSMGVWANTDGKDTLYPAEAVEQILASGVPAGEQPMLDTTDDTLARFFTGLTSPDGEEIIPVHVSGWGVDGKDEAVLLIARRANGSLYWQGIVTAPGGFE